MPDAGTRIGARPAGGGCGGGAPVATAMVARGLRVTGVDTSPTLISPTLISLWRECMPDAEWIEGDMRSPRLGRTFDGILAWDSVFHLFPDDQRRMFAVFARHGAREATGKAVGRRC